MKKGQIMEGRVLRTDFPNKGYVSTLKLDDEPATGEDYGAVVVVKNAVEGQMVRARINKKKNSHFEAGLMEVLEEGVPTENLPLCQNSGKCGGCLYRTRSYEDTLKIKEAQIHKLLDGACKKDGCASEQYEFEGILGSPVHLGYRNKMELSFGDSVKDGPLVLGLHRRNSMFDVLDTGDCLIASPAMNLVQNATLEYFRRTGADYYHKMSHQGYLRHLLVRQSHFCKELLVALVTTSQTEKLSVTEAELMDGYREAIIGLEGQLKELGVSLAGILHLTNDSVADVVRADRQEILFGRDFIDEELLGLKFKITPFSFFQTNSAGAEVLYSKVREYIGTELDSGSGEKVVYDLYSGTGTISQLVAPVSKKVIGVEIVEEAVESARESSAENGLSDRCEFIASDVLKALDDIEDLPDCIILDPPREGVHPKALSKILSYGVQYIVYVSCKATSLVEDLEMVHAHGYHVVKACAVDMFPYTGGIETVCLLSNRKQKPDSYVKLSLNMEDYYRIKDAEKE